MHLLKKIEDFSETLNDSRTGKNTSYSFKDIFMAGYSVFHMQSQSFLAHQKRLESQFAKHNGKTLFGFDTIPSDNHIRNALDQLSPQALEPLVDSLLQDINREEFLTQGGLVVALDGVNFFSSSKISCPCCLKKEHANGTRYYHSLMCPALIHPEQKCALPMMPEFINNQDGYEKQDCEMSAAKRWCEKKRVWLQDNKVTILGDDLFSRAPIVKQLMSYRNVRFIFVAKPTSHAYLQECLDVQTRAPCQTIKTTEKMGKKERIYTYKIYRDVPLNGDKDAPFVHYFEMTVTNEKGKVIYINSFITNHDIRPENIHAIARTGRNRWKIENEAFNILKTKGYHFEHNFGHGKKNLANVFACFNLIAFLVHHFMALIDARYVHLYEMLGARTRVFQLLNYATMIQVFDSWDHLLSFLSSTIRKADC